MAVASSTASDSTGPGPEGPIRTCIGCRQRGAAAELIRVVVAPDARGEGAAQGSSPGLGGGPVSLPVVPDLRRRIAGRGAWLHPVTRCAELAVRRRAFARALRVPGAVDPTPVCEYVAKIDPDANQPAETRRR